MRKFRFILIAIFYANIKYVVQATCPSENGCKCRGIFTNCARASLNFIPESSPLTEIYNLGYNLLQYIKPGSFENLPRLRTLYLNNNNLKSIGRDDFFGLTELIDLHLYSNLIESINSLAFGTLQKIQNIYLQQNRLKQIETNTFSHLPHLQALFLSFNQLKTFPWEENSKFSSLRKLNLDGNRLVCNCDILWFLKNITHYSNSIDLKADCYEPRHLHNRPFKQLQIKDLNCDEPVIIDKPMDVEIRLGEYLTEARFHCKVTGVPKPKIYWQKSGNRLDLSEKYSIFNDDDSTLIIKDVSELDAGIYECVGSNEIGEVVASSELRVSNDQKFDEYYVLDQDDANLNNDDSLKFLQMPDDLTVLEGHQLVKFICRSNDLHAQIKWLKDGNLIVETNRIYQSQNGVLEIKNLRVEDEGFYVCSMSNKKSIKYAQGELVVNVPPSFLKRPLNQDVAQGNSIEFYCSVSGKPVPEITWKKDGKLLKANKDNYEYYQNGHLLKINNIKQDDEGYYTCTAKNIVSTIESTARLHVNHPIKPFFKIIQQNISVFEDHPITLECFAHGDPKPQVMWFKNGQRISTDSRVYFDSFGYLAITHVKLSDSGEYICKAANIAGSVIHKFFLSVKDIYGTVISNSVIRDAIEAAKNDISKQFQNTLNSLNDRRKPKTSADLLALLRFPKDKTLNLVLSEEIYERALGIIFLYANNITFNLTNQNFVQKEEILTHRQLQTISDLSGCLRHKRKVNCSNRCLKYRTFDGVCNNLDNPHRGAANTPLRRLLNAEYQNGFSTPRGWNKSQLYHGFMLPNARDVSTHIITTNKVTDDKTFTHMLMQWGQFLDHDISHTVMAMSLNRFSNGIACRDSCTNDQPCFPIEILPNDTLRTHWPGKCMEFVRSSAVCGSGETSLVINKIHQREQINQLTTFIDGSNVYGSNDQDAFDIRERVPNSGKLKVHITTKYPKGLLPFNLDTNMDCQRENTTTVGCFMAGDYRANEQLALLAMHNLWIRQHNTLVDKLKHINSHWSPEQLYQESRKIVGAQLQSITFRSWLPKILGQTGMKKLGEYKKYDPSVDVTVSNEFATAAFRFGHALIQPFTFRLNESFQPIPEGNLLLRDSFFAPQRYYYEGGMDPLMRGLFGVPAKIKMPREIMNDELTEKLFHIVRSVSQDLAALNIQRGRDHGIQGYAAYRRICNMTDVNNFDDLKNEISSRQVRDILKKLYGDVRNIDIWPGGMLEDVVEGSKLGPLFMCIILEQMKALRNGDRYWHENPGVFTPAQLVELKKTSLAKIICENSDTIEYIQEDVFLNARFPSQMKKCSDIEDISLEPWRNCCQDNLSGLCKEEAYYYTQNESNGYN